MQLIHLSHAAQQHGGIDQCIDPGKALEVMVAQHADDERAKDDHDGDEDINQLADEEFVGREQGLFAMLEHGSTSIQDEPGGRDELSIAQLDWGLMRHELLASGLW